jgi:hypothetical protein
MSLCLSPDIGMSNSTEDDVESLLRRIQDASNTLAKDLEVERDLLAKLSKKVDRYRSLLQDVKKSILDPIYETPEALFELLDDKEAMLSKNNLSHEDHTRNVNLSSDGILPPAPYFLDGGDRVSKKESFVSLESTIQIDR